MIKAIKMMFDCIKMYRRISKLHKIQFKLIKEIQIELNTYKKYNLSDFSNELFKATDCINEHIQILQKQIDELEERIKGMCKSSK
jgi:hypothetical protein